MKKHNEVLMGMATAIALVVSTAVFADDFQTVLKNEQVRDKPKSAFTSKNESNAWSMQSLVEENRSRVDEKRILQSDGIAGMKKPITDGWREALGEPVKL